jgi:hypothetical protein
MDQVGQEYLTLALNLDRHFEGFVDAYFGPEELRDAIRSAEPRALDALADDARQLQAAIEVSIKDPQRKGFLARQALAMATVVRKLSGEQLDYVEEVELCFDISPQMVDEAVFEAAHAEMDRCLPGDGPLVERLEVWKHEQEIGADRILPAFQLAREETRRRTRSLLDLPPGEDVSLHLVADQPWSAYNWYLGNYRSRIDLNTDLPIRIGAVVPLMAHEAYPGHHTEHALKEYDLYRKQGRAEHAVQLLVAPESVLSEGIADSARAMILDDGELAAFLRDQLYPRAGLPPDMVEQQMRLAGARENLSGLGGNAALLLHRDGRSPTQVQRYIEQYGLLTPREAAQSMKFIQSTLFRAYIFTYTSGKRLLAPLLEGSQAHANFRRLLSEPYTPGMVCDWLARS